MTVSILSPCCRITAQIREKDGEQDILRKIKRDNLFSGYFLNISGECDLTIVQFWIFVE